MSVGNFEPWDEDAVRTATMRELLKMALSATYEEERRHLWDNVVMRLAQLEFDALDAVVILHCMVKLDCRDRALLRNVVDRIEGRYFGMDLGQESHAAWEMFPNEGTYTSLVRGLPLDHKVKIILMSDVARESGRLPKPPPLVKEDVKKRWRTLDPVEMEALERERFEKGRLKVKRMRHVEARVTRMPPGRRLRSALALQLLQMLPSAEPEALAEIAQVCVFPQVRLLSGDFQEYFHEALARRVVALDTHQVLPHILAITSAMQGFTASQASRAWKRRLLPAVMRIARSPRLLAEVESQAAFRPRLLAAPHLTGAPGTQGAEASLRSRMERVAEFFIAVTSAKHVAVDTDLFNSLAAPLRQGVEQWLSDARGGTVDAAAPENHLLPLETLADVFSACVSCGVSDRALLQLLAELFAVQFGEDILEKKFALSPYSAADLSNIAHAGALCCDDASELIMLVWVAAAPKLKATEPHLALMLLNAVVRGGPEALLTSAELVEAVDEHLVQKLDYDPMVLGHIGS